MLSRISEMSRKSKYTKSILEPLVKSSVSWSELLRKLGLTNSGGNYSHIKGRVSACGLSTNHFTGQAWRKGKTGGSWNKIPDSEVFVKGSSYNTSRLKDRLLSIGWEYRCDFCGLGSWRGEYIRLVVDHINGDSTDHRLRNLRFLCPNCHSQTSTFAGKNHYYKAKRVFCADCSEEISGRATRCKSCAMKKQKRFKIDWPSCDKLKKMLDESNYSELGRRLGVSDNAIRKHIKKHCSD